MKRKKDIVCLALVLVVALLSACSNVAASALPQTIVEMELTENYDVSDTFIHAKLFCVSENIETLELEISVQMEGESGFLEISDNDTKEIFWSDIWNENTEMSTFTVTLNALDKEKDYVVQFTGTKIKYAKIVVSSQNSLVKELERPRAK